MSDAELWKEAYEAIDKKYKIYFERILKEVPDDYLEKFYNSIAHIFDPHTVYLPPKKKEDFDIDISGSLEGIGAVLQEGWRLYKSRKHCPRRGGMAGEGAGS